MTADNLTRRLRRARSRGASLIVITTADQPSVLKTIREELEQISADDPSGRRPLDPLVAWDTVRGAFGANETGETIIARMAEATSTNPSMVGDLPTLLDMANTPCPSDGQISAVKGTTLVVFNAHRLVTPDVQGSLQVVQAIQNARDTFGSTLRALVMLCPSWPAPVELGSDVLILDDPLPGDEERAELARKLIRNAQRSPEGCPIDNVDLAVRACSQNTRGLSRYATLQTIALSLSKAGLSEEELRRRFVSAINSTPGLTFEPEPVPLDSIGGLSNFKAYAQALAGGRKPPQAVVFIDEIEKAIAGSSGAAADSSGASQAILGALLTYMEDERAGGLIALGPPGSGKSMSAKALGGVIGVPTVRLDVGALKGSLVGQTEANVRAALKALKQLAGQVFVVATCNSEVNLPPELGRRFTSGTWFFDLPDAEERATIWGLYLRKHGFENDAPRPADGGWTGAEIRACVERAWDLRITPAEAARWIVPVSKSKADQITSLRRSSSGRYVSASKPGVYTFSDGVAQSAFADRSISLGA